MSQLNKDYRKITEEYEQNQPRGQRAAGDLLLYVVFFIGMAIWVSLFFWRF